jgi:hypothetical protein
MTAPKKGKRISAAVYAQLNKIEKEIQKQLASPPPFDPIVVKPMRAKQTILGVGTHAANGDKIDFAMDDRINATIVQMTRQLDEAQQEQIYDLMAKAWAEGVAHKVTNPHVCASASTHGGKHCNPYLKENRGRMLGERSFTCEQCGATSHNPNDVRERYCGNCHKFADAWLGGVKNAEDQTPADDDGQGEQASDHQPLVAARLRHLRDHDLLRYAPSEKDDEQDQDDDEGSDADVHVRTARTDQAPA